MRHRFTHFRFILCFLAVLISFVSFGQGTRTREYSGVFDTYYFRGPISYTGSISLASYRGDLSKRLFGTLGPMFSLGANYKLWPRTIFGAELSYFHLASKDFTGGHNLGFKSSDIELDLYGRLLLIDDIQRKGSDKLSKPARLKPYIMSGIGLLKYRPASYYLIDSGAVQTEGIIYPRWGFVIPVGLGLSVFINHRVSVIAEVNYRISFSDYLDDISKRADPKTKDGYTSMSLKIQYTPTAPKAKKKKTHAPPPAYEGTKGTDTWKNKKKEPKALPYEEIPLPYDKSKEANPENPNPDNKENNPENTDPNNSGDGDKNIQNQVDEPAKDKAPDEIK